MTQVVIALTVVVGLAMIGYQAYVTPATDRAHWTPPAGLSAKETPDWLQTLCADQTPELCAAANRARTATDCEGMRAALHALEATQRKLTARHALSQRQYWVLVELYGQGNQLCQFEHKAP